MDQSYDILHPSFSPPGLSKMLHRALTGSGRRHSETAWARFAVKSDETTIVTRDVGVGGSGAKLSTYGREPYAGRSPVQASTVAEQYAAISNDEYS